MNVYLRNPPPCLPIVRNLRHLILDTSQLPTLLGGLSALTSLETLSLRAVNTLRSKLQFFPAINLAHVTKLKHLRFMDFVTADLIVPEGCQLHACLNTSWLEDMVRPPGCTPIAWMRCPMWTTISGRLGSLCLSLRLGAPDEGKLQDLQDIVHNACQLDFVRLEAVVLGSKNNPFDIFSVFSRIKRVVIVVGARCWLKCAPSCAYLCKHLSVQCKGELSMKLQEVTALVCGLCSFSIQYKALGKSLSTSDLVCYTRCWDTYGQARLAR